MRAHINFEDDPHGPGMSVQACYVNGFNQDSTAHRSAALLMKYLDTLAARMPTEPEVLIGDIHLPPPVEPLLP